MLTAASGFAESFEKAEAVCFEAQRNVNALADFTHTSCLPSLGRKNSRSFILLSDQPVFSTEASKKSWLLVSVAAVGDALNKRPSFKADELWLSDAVRTKEHLAFVIPAEVAKSLQQRIKRDDITLETMYREILSSLSRRQFSKP